MTSGPTAKPMTHLEQVDAVFAALMFNEHRDKAGRMVRTVSLTPDVVSAMSIRDAARYFESPTFGADAAVRSARARDKGEALEPVAVSLSPEKRAQLAGA